MAVGNVYEVILDAELFGQDCQNVFHYQQTVMGSGNVPLALAEAFQAIVLDGLANLSSNQLDFERIVVFNLDNLSETHEDVSPTPSNGVRAVATLPSWVTVSLKSTRPSLHGRASYKRFSGTDVGFLSGNQLSGTGITEWNNFADAMAGSLTNNANVFAPVQIRKLPGGGVSNYVVNYQIQDWNVEVDLSPQLSRYPGHGD